MYSGLRETENYKLAQIIRQLLKVLRLLFRMPQTSFHYVEYWRSKSGKNMNGQKNEKMAKMVKVPNLRVFILSMERELETEVCGNLLLKTYIFERSNKINN